LGEHVEEIPQQGEVHGVEFTRIGFAGHLAYPFLGYFFLAKFPCLSRNLFSEEELPMRLSRHHKGMKIFLATDAFFVEEGFQYPPGYGTAMFLHDVRVYWKMSINLLRKLRTASL
jgi:hypothetical protein